MKAQVIASRLNVSLFKANMALGLIRGRFEADDYPRRFPKTCEWINQCYNKPSHNELILNALDELLEMCGVEAISDSRFYVDSYHGDIIASYLNTGDTYCCTILLDHLKNRWKLISWGDFVESLDDTSVLEFEP